MEIREISAQEEKIALCKDAGLAVVFVEMGQDVHIVGGHLTASINEGVRQGYRDGYLRKSSLDPLIIIHAEIIPGDKLKLTVATKGFGAEKEIGPEGLGDRVTALDVHIETYPTHNCYNKLCYSLEGKL